MRTLFGLVVSGTLAFALCGCGTPEAEFSWSEDTQDLMPAAEKAVKEYTTARFGTPANMVGWQRLPIAFGGVPGRVVDVYTELHANPKTGEEEEYVVGFSADFLTHAMLAKYDVNLDNRLGFWELPFDLQQEVTAEKFQAADADGDGFLTPAEVGKLRVRSEMWVNETVSLINADNAEELVGKELLFPNGTFQYREGEEEQYKVKVTAIDAETGRIDIAPYIAYQTEDSEPVDLVFQDIIIDFGRTMRTGRHLYMRHCMHCHGVTGDGNGPTAEYLNPRPRDYRDGVFKFVSTRRDIVGGRANRDDLDRILRHGIPGTYMPSFSMLTDQEVTDIIEYVRWLAMRGQYEQSMNVVLIDFANKTLAEEVKRKVANYEAALKAYEEEGTGKKPEVVSESTIRSEKQKELKDFLAEDLREDMEEEVDLFLETWHDSEVYNNIVYPKVSKPPSTPDSIARGRQLYLGKCAVCHGAMAEGNGENTRGYQKDPEGNEYPEPGFFDIWGHPIEPRNLTLGIYRGGRRPLDIYRRISQGIPGTPMQAFNAAFTDEQMWDLVDYVMSIPIDGAVPSGPNENVISLQAASELPPNETGEGKPKAPKVDEQVQPEGQTADAEQPAEKKPAVAEQPGGKDSAPENEE